MLLKKGFLLFLTFLVVSTSLFAQTKLATIRGYVKDIANNKFVRSCNIKLLDEKGSLLQKITTTEGNGHFVFNEVPLGKYILTLSHINYREKQMSISTSSSIDIDLDTIAMEYNVRTLEEVAIKPAIYYNRDTLEINTDSFKLDSNAVISDLLRKVPDFVIWGDGDITFRGQPIKNFVLNGKTFLSGSPEILLQNIPKTAISSIQLYNVLENKNKVVQDSSLEMNIKTKSNSLSYFGTLSHIFGKRYDSSIGLTMFTKQAFQASAFFNRNNVNKMILNNDDFLEQTTYQSTTKIASNDILKPGENKLTIYGLTSKYSFTNKPQHEKTDELQFSLSSGSNNIDDRRGENMNNESLLVSRNYRRYENRNMREKAGNLRYTYKTKVLEVSSSLVIEKRNTDSKLVDSSLYKLDTVISQLHNNDNRSREENSLNYQLRSKYTFPKSRMSLGGEFNFGQSDQEESQDAVFTVQNNRKKRDSENRLQHTVTDIKLDISNVVLSQAQGVSFFAGSRNIIHSWQEDRMVLDNFVKTDALSFLNTRKQYENELNTGISIRRNKILSNRYEKRYGIDLSIEAKYHLQKQRSDQNVLNDSLTSPFIFPALRIFYEKDVTNRYESNMTFRIYGTMVLPSQEKRVRLVDTINPYLVEVANTDLRAEKQFISNFRIERSQKSFNYHIDIKATLIKNAFVNSTFSKDGNFPIYSLSNSDRTSRRLNLEANIRKQIKFKQAVFTGYAFVTAENNDIPVLNNAVFVASQYNNFRINALVNATINEKWTLGLSSLYSRYFIKRDVSYSFANINSKLDLQYVFKKNLQLSGSFLLDGAITERTTTQNSILNFAVNYRFLKQKNMEVNFNVWDLLKNNKALVNSFDGLNYITGYNNRIQQYFTIGLKYFPRKF